MAASPYSTGVAQPAGILLVDDHELVRLGLRTLIASSANAAGSSALVFEARTLQDALSVYRSSGQQIGMVLLDLNLTDSHGLAGLQRFVHEFPAARVAVLTGSADPTLARRACALGAAAFLPKTADLTHILEYLVQQGLLPAAADRAGAWSESGNTAQAQSSASTTNGRVDAVVTWTAGGQRVELSQRQSQVLEWLLAGRSNRDIAELMHLSEGTVKNHVSNLLLLFSVRSRTQLVSLLR